MQYIFPSSLLLTQSFPESSIVNPEAEVITSELMDSTVLPDESQQRRGMLDLPVATHIKPCELRAISSVLPTSPNGVVLVLPKIPGNE